VESKYTYVCPVHENTCEMTNQFQSSKALHITLWLAQLTLAASLIWATTMKWTQPLAALSTMWPWTGQVPDGFVRFTGLVDLLGAAGLVLPALLRIRPALTPIAALGVVALMVCASIFHIVRGEASVIGVNLVFALLAVFIAWGRLTKAPIAAR